MYTRESFDRQRTAAQQASTRHERVLALVAVTLGVAQLLFIKWADANLAHRTTTGIAGSLFLAYAALITWLLGRRHRAVRAARPVCPQCGAGLEGLSERVAGATGRCDACGGQVIQDQ